MLWWKHCQLRLLLAHSVFVCLCFVFYVLITSSSRLTEVTALAQWCLISVHIFLPNLCQHSGITAMVFSACIVEKSKNKITKGRLFTGLSVCLLNNSSVHSFVLSFILNASACLSVCLMWNKTEFHFFTRFQISGVQITWSKSMWPHLEAFFILRATQRIIRSKYTCCATVTSKRNHLRNKSIEPYCSTTLTHPHTKLNYPNMHTERATELREKGRERERRKGMWR